MGFLVFAMISTFLIIVFVVLLVFNYKRDWEAEPIIIPALIMSIVASICGWFFFGQSCKQYTKHVSDIVSIKREGETDGSFFLGCGNIETTQYYFYYYEVSPNKYKLGKVETNKSYIIEDDSKTPSIYEIKEFGSLSSYYDIYVPVGTIVTTFVLN